MLLSTYSDNNDFIMSETNGSVGAVIILLLNAFDQPAILTVSYVICKACYALFMVAKNESRSRYPPALEQITIFNELFDNRNGYIRGLFTCFFFSFDLAHMLIRLY